MRSSLMQVLVLCFLATPLHAQGLRGQVADLFRFGDCGEPLCLDVDSGHGSHFIAASTQQTGQIIAFVANAIGTSIANVPIGSASGGSTFTFEGGLPVRSAVSSGPIFAERAQTIGRGRVLAGANATVFRFTSLRGTPLDALSFNFTHINVGSPLYGDPSFENDVIQVTTDLDVSLAVASLFATYGLTDRIDVGISVPLVHTAVSGHSHAQILPFGPTPHHFAGGTGLMSDASMSGSATGIGDITLRGKARLAESGAAGFAVLADVRLPTGKDEDLLGSGSTSVRGLAIASARYGDFSPHANGGFVWRGGEFERSAILATAGFDQLLAPWATLALDVISTWEVGEKKLSLPEPRHFDVPYERTLALTNIRNGHDDIIYTSVGAKLSRGENLTVVVNGLIPVLRGGLQPNVAWTLGFEYNP